MAAIVSDLLPKLIGSELLRGQIRQGMRVFVQGSTGLPRALLAALDAARIGDLEVIIPLLPGVNAPLSTPVTPPNRLTTIRPLIDSGAMTGARKSRDVGRHVAGALSGDTEFYAWAAARKDIAMRPVSYTHALAVLRELDYLVAINSALEIDLFGQANAEMVGTRQISGSGGLLDFVRGARASRGGRAIICMAATSGDGQRSNVVARLGGVATVPRTDVDIVVTEYGVARLRHQSVEQRAEALIGIAAPGFRKQLEQD